MHNKETYMHVCAHIDIRVYPKYACIIRICIVWIYLSCTVHESFVQNKPLESLQWAAVNAENENIRNSAGDSIWMTDSSQIQKEATVMTTGAVSARTTTLIGFLECANIVFIKTLHILHQESLAYTTHLLA